MGGSGTASAQAAVVSVDNFLAYPQAQTVSVHALGGVEGVEDPVYNFCGHANSVIRDGKLDAFGAAWPIGGGAASNKQAASGWYHGVNGVADDVVQYLANLSVEAFDGLQRPLPQLYLDASIDDAALLDGQDALKHFMGCNTDSASGLFVEAKRLVGDG